MFNIFDHFTVATGSEPGTVSVNATTAKGRRAIATIFGPAVVGVEIPRENYARLLDKIREVSA